jgi:hypothetical protein
MQSERWSKPSEKAFCSGPQAWFYTRFSCSFTFFCPCGLVSTCRESGSQQREHRRYSGGALLLTKGRGCTPCDLPFFPLLVCLRLTITELLGRRIEISVTMLLTYLPTTSTQLLPQGYRPHHTCNHARKHARTQHAHNRRIAQTHSNRKSTNTFLSAKSPLTFYKKYTQTHRDTATHITFPILISLAQTQTHTHRQDKQSQNTYTHTHTHTHKHTHFLSPCRLCMFLTLSFSIPICVLRCLSSLCLFSLSLSLSLLYDMHINCDTYIVQYI